MKKTTPFTIVSKEKKIMEHNMEPRNGPKRVWPTDFQ